MRKLNGKNKLFIAIFSIIVIVIIVILVASVFIAQKNGKTVYNVSSNSVVFDSETNIIDTSSGGTIYERWDGTYYYLNKEEIIHEIGNVPVVYEKAKDNIEIFGTNYLIKKDGTVLENNEVTKITEYSEPLFYKLEDRKYLIVAGEIYNQDKTIYASKYLVVQIDKKGNASVLNDSINVKTINPMTLTFDKYTFDIANEKLLIDNKTIDLKLVNGSTNEYKPKTEDPNENIDLDMKDLAEQYNNLVNSFEQYMKDSASFMGSTQEIINNNNFIVTNPNGSNQSNNSAAINLTNITKSVSLRGAVANTTHIDITYTVSDVADKYQVVFLLITGLRDGKQTTEKVIVDKYSSNYRVTGLSPRNEYSISLGYIERVKDPSGAYILLEQIEDVINVRTIKPALNIEIDKISKGYVHFTFKMNEYYSLDSGKISLYVEDKHIDSVNINVVQALHKNGFKSKMKLTEGNVIELRLEDAVYNEQYVEIDIGEKFTY